MPELTLTDPKMVILAAVTALVAGFVRGFTGFGGPAMMLLVLTQFYSPISVLTKVMMIDVVANVKLLPSTLHEVHWHVAAPVIIGSVIGAPLGFYALLVVDPVIMKRVIALVTGVCTIVMMTGWRFRTVPRVPVHLAVGIVAGVALGSTFIALVVVVYLFSGPWAGATSRANAVVWGFLVGIGLFAAHCLFGTIGFDDVWRSLAIGVVYLGAAAIGARAFRVVAEQTFRRMVLWLLLVLAAIGLLV